MSDVLVPHTVITRSGSYLAVVTDPEKLAEKLVLGAATLGSGSWFQFLAPENAGNVMVRCDDVVAVVPCDLASFLEDLEDDSE